MLPQDQAIVITVSGQRIIVCRRRTHTSGSITYECARNVDELEDDAMLALAQRHEPFMSGQEFSCPPELAARAQWN
jgi:hypothetical protein